MRCNLRRGSALTATVLAVLVLCWGCSSKPNPPGGAQEGAQEGQQLLDAMFAAYHGAEAYADNGVWRFQTVDRADHLLQDAPPQTVAISFERPNRLRLTRQEFDAAGRPVASWNVVSNGNRVRSTTPEFPGQILETVAPLTLNVENVIASDSIRKAVLSMPLPDLYPQLDMLISTTPQEDALSRDRIQLLEDEMLDGRACRRVALSNPDGRRVYWIDKETQILHRLDLPTHAIKKEFDPSDQLEKIEMWLEFRDAEFSTSLPAEAFEMEVPPKALRVREFVTSAPAPMPPVLGRTISDFSFADAEGNTVDRAALAGKIVVLDFWFVACPHCRQGMPAFETIHQSYADEDRVAFLAVNTDPPEAPTDEIETQLRDWGSTSRLVRDPKLEAAAQFRVTGFPTIVLLDGDAMVHYFGVGSQASGEALRQTIDALLAGTDVARQTLDQYRAEVRQYEVDLAAAAVDSDERQIEIVPARIAPKSEPENHTRELLWQAKNSEKPGNILIVEPSGEAPTILVIEGDRTVIELNIAGEEIARHALDLPEGAVITFLRSAVRKNGKRVYVASGVGRQQLHLFDDAWHHRLSFPDVSFPDGHHSGIADVRFADLDGDGEPEIHVGYWGDVGLQGVSLEGKRLWADRSIAQVVQVAVEPTERGRDVLWCTNSRGTLVPINNRGHRPEVPVDHRMIMNLVIAGADEDGTADWCGLAVRGVGEYEAVGIDAEGRALWSYPIPKGEYPNQVDRIVPVPQSIGGGWALPAADGSIHGLTGDGRLMGRFNYGAAITGLAITHSGGQPMLLVASKNGLEAWKLTPK